MIPNDLENVNKYSRSQRLHDCVVDLCPQHIEQVELEPQSVTHTNTTATVSGDRERPKV